MHKLKLHLGNTSTPGLRHTEVKKEDDTQKNNYERDEWIDTDAVLKWKEVELRSKS